MSNIEYQSMFALWCLIKAPLMLGTDLTQMSMESESYKIISNERLIAINQDSLGKKIFLSNFSCTFLNLNNFSNLNSYCSNSLDMRRLQKQVRKAFCYQKLFWTFTV